MNFVINLSVVVTTTSPLNFHRPRAIDHLSKATFRGLEIVIIVVFISDAEPTIVAISTTVCLHQRNLLWFLGVELGELQVQDDDKDDGAGEVPAELQVDERLGTVERLVGAASDDVVAFF